MLSDHERFYLETDVHFIPTPAKYKKSAPFLSKVDNQALIQEHNKLSQAFRNFFRNPVLSAIPALSEKKMTATRLPPATSFLAAAPPSTSRKTPCG